MPLFHFKSEWAGSEDGRIQYSSRDLFELSIATDESVRNKVPPIIPHIIARGWLDDGPE
jgi:hypothetical protein